MLAHTHLLGHGGSLKKGHLLDAGDVAGLASAGIARVFVARLEPDDLSEDAAAHRLAVSVAGPHLTLTPATTGRANLFAAARGVLVVDRAGVDALNSIDERLTFATRPPWAVVAAGELTGTVKIIPFAVPRQVVERAVPRRPLVRVAPFSPLRAGLILTSLGLPRVAMEAQATANQRQRLAALGGQLVLEARVPHTVQAVAEALRTQLDAGLELLLVLGASAIVDRGDVIPTAIERMGGVVEHLGMPVDPGNLLLLGRAGRVPIVGVPGCARTLRRSGFDQVLERLAARLEVTPADLMALGVGGLLLEPARGSGGEGSAAPLVSVPSRTGGST